MNILYLGAFPPDFLIKSSGGKIDSLYRDDQAIIRGLRLQQETNVKVVTSPDIASWPKGPLLIRREESTEEDLVMVSSLNLSLIKQPWTILSMVKEANRIIRKCKGPVVVIIPFLVFRHVLTLRILKWLHPKRVVQAVVVPDIFFPSKWIIKQLNNLTETMASKFDAYVLYTKKMAEHLHVKEGKYEIIEGFRQIPERKPVQSEKFTVVYAGSLNLNYGVGRLIEAMSLINDADIQLHLYGAGTAESLINEVCNKDRRIIFHGKVPNAESVEAIYSASVLINPRNATDGEYTEYSFPSKDIEYMATGIPTLLCKLPGMPKEYYGFFIDIEQGTPEQIAKAILRVKSMPPIERESIGIAARGFISERMDCANQGKRIVDLCNKVLFFGQ